MDKCLHAVGYQANNCFAEVDKTQLDCTCTTGHILYEGVKYLYTYKYLAVVVHLF